MYKRICSQIVHTCILFWLVKKSFNICSRQNKVIRRDLRFDQQPLVWKIEVSQTGLWSSTCGLVFGCWELSHVFFFMLRKKELNAKICKFKKWQLFSLKMVLGCRLEWKWLSFCEFAQLCKQFFLSQQEIYHVT